MPTKKKKETSFEDLVDEALGNAREDREKILEAFEKMKGALDLNGADGVEKAMLVGDKAIKILESLTKNNAQIVQVAQIKERQESRNPKEQEKLGPISMAEIKKMAESEGIKTRVEEEEEIEEEAEKKKEVEAE